MSAVGDEGGVEFRLGLLGDEATQVESVLSGYSETVSITRLESVPDVFEQDRLDAIILADSTPLETYEAIRQSNPYQPTVVLADDEIEELSHDEYARVVVQGGASLPVALVISRARQLARKPRTGTESARSGDRSVVPIHRERSREFVMLWAVATLAYGVGDTFTTIVGVEGYGLEESNPFVDLILDVWGIGGFVTLKIAVFGILLAISLYHSGRRETVHYYWPPLLLIGVGVFLTAWNTVMIVL